MEIGLLPNAFAVLSKHQERIKEATAARDETIRIVAESQLGDLTGYKLALNLSDSGGTITATRKQPAPAPKENTDAN